MNRKDGVPVNAVFGFTNMLVKLIEDYRKKNLLLFLMQQEKILEIKFIKTIKQIEVKHLKI